MSQYLAVEDSGRTSQETRVTSDCGCLCLLKRRYLRAHKCVGSKAAVLILIWVFLAHLTFWLTSSGLATILKQFKSTSSESINFYILIASTLPYIFYPLAGYLADIKFGRFKTILRGTYLLLTFLIIFSIMLLPILQLSHKDVPYFVVYLVILMLSAVCLLVIIAFATINANFIQYGIDQLHDSPEGHQSLFIHWYLWVVQFSLYATQVLMYFLLTYIKPEYYLLMFFLLIIIIFAFILVIKKQKSCFLIDNTRPNPYRLVYAVTKFARQHKVPIRRSAFTYCEDDVPSGLDLGKTKYGGPFTTEQVEDVKAFYGILKVLLTLGPVYALNDIKRTYTYRNNTDIRFNGLPYLLVVITIPLYVILVRPFIYYYLPGVLKRIGLGVIATLLSMICTFLIIEIAIQVSHAEILCYDTQMIIHVNNTGHISGIGDNYHFHLILPDFIHSLSIILFQISLYEFICCQSPNSTKGLLIGLSFAINGILQTFFYGLNAIFPYIHIPFLSCGTVYYIICISLILISFIVYVYFARNYQLRKRDEICPVYRYAEEYYSKLDPK